MDLPCSSLCIVFHSHYLTHFRYHPLPSTLICFPFILSGRSSHASSIVLLETEPVVKHITTQSAGESKEDDHSRATLPPRYYQFSMIIPDQLLPSLSGQLVKHVYYVQVTPLYDIRSASEELRVPFRVSMGRNSSARKDWEYKAVTALLVCDECTGDARGEEPASPNVGRDGVTPPLPKSGGRDRPPSSSALSSSGSAFSATSASVGQNGARSSFAEQRNVSRSRNIRSQPSDPSPTNTGPSMLFVCLFEIGLVLILSGPCCVSCHSRDFLKILTRHSPVSFHAATPSISIIQSSKLRL